MGIFERDYMKRRTPDESASAEPAPVDNEVRRWKWIFVGALVLILIAFVTLPQKPARPGNTLPQSRSTAPTNAVTFPLDANTATVDELLAIPFLRPDTANAIIAARPFHSFKDIDRAYGIGPKTLERLKPYLAVSATNAPASQ